MPYISSPLNYTGGKYKLLSSIIPHFPKDINTFVDLFCGGCNVGVNVNANNIVFNDKQNVLSGLFSYFLHCDIDDFIKTIHHIINKYGLSSTKDNGYDYYNCNSSEGLGKYNRDKYLILRQNFNLSKEDIDYYPTLYVLICYAFNNQIRFNSKGEYNLPVGKRDFNSQMEKKLKLFINHIQQLNCQFTSVDFVDFNYNELTPNDFVYADPPYLITCATYNERNGWTNNMELSLYDILNQLHNRGVRFALSNVLSTKGKQNPILEQWLSDNPHLICHHLNKSYNNSNYHRNKDFKSDEVLITNYI